MSLFITIMVTEFIAEMGDKTQLMLVAMASRFKLRDIILGTAAAILFLNGLAVAAGGIISVLVPEWLIRLVAACAFFWFSLTSLREDDDDGDEIGGKSFSFAPLAVFATFFVAELGDKTQLTAITFGANEGIESGITVWLACSLGLFLADILGMLAGYFLKSRISGVFLKKLSYVIFGIYGFLTLRQGLLIMNMAKLNQVLGLAAACFVLISMAMVLHGSYRRTREK